MVESVAEGDAPNVIWHSRVVQALVEIVVKRDALKPAAQSRLVHALVLSIAECVVRKANRKSLGVKWRRDIKSVRSGLDVDGLAGWMQRASRGKSHGNLKVHMAAVNLIHMCLMALVNLGDYRICKPLAIDTLHN